MLLNRQTHLSELASNALEREKQAQAIIDAPTSSDDQIKLAQSSLAAAKSDYEALSKEILALQDIPSRSLTAPTTFLSPIPTPTRFFLRSLKSALGRRSIQRR